MADVDEIVSDSARLARNVRRNAHRLVSPGRERDAAGASADFPHVYAWNELVLNRPAICSCCGAAIARGERGYFGLSDDAEAEPACLCARCVEALPEDPS